MNPRAYPWSRSLLFFMLLSGTFAAGLLVERGGTLLVHYLNPPVVSDQTIAPFWETWRLADKHFVNREALDPKKMTRGAIEGLLMSLGDYGHTTYVSPEELKRMETRLNEGRMEGIGARMTLKKRLPTVIHTLPGSPAEKAGLKPGDVFLQVNGQSVTGLPLDRVVNQVIGPAGEPVRIRVARPGKSKPLDFEIIRAQVDVPDVTWSMLPGQPIAHVAIQNFGAKSHEQLKEALKQAQAKNAKGLIVDVRGNPGGIKDQAVAVTSEFLSGGTVFVERDAKGNETKVPVLHGASAPDIPLCLLVDEGSASSSEIFAGAIQDHKRGKLVGMRTFGTGTVLQPFQLSDGGAVLLAVAEWLTPNGRKIWHKGISPDIEISLPEEATILLPETEGDLDVKGLAQSDDKQLLKALDVLKEQLR
jgi:carboxyl-terminal processing protease